MTMIRSIFSFAASVSVAAVLVGCAGQAPVSGHSEPSPAKVIPVYIAPNCTIIGGLQHCQWITPRGYEPPSESAAAPAKSQVKGIAL